MCVLGSHTFVPISWKCKRQAAVSRISAESETASLDASSRVDGFPALFNFGECVLDTFCCKAAKGHIERHTRDRVSLSQSHSEVS